MPVNQTGPYMGGNTFTNYGPGANVNSPPVLQTSSLDELLKMLSQLGISGLSGLKSLFTNTPTAPMLTGGVATNPYMGDLTDIINRLQNPQRLPNLDPASLQALAAMKQDQLSEAQGVYDQNKTDLVNRLYAQGLQHSTPGDRLASQMQGQFGRAVSGIEADAGARELQAKQQAAAQMLAQLQAAMTGVQSQASLQAQADAQNQALQMQQYQSQLQQAADQRNAMMQLLQMLMANRSSSSAPGPGYGYGGDQMSEEEKRKQLLANWGYLHPGFGYPPTYGANYPAPTEPGATNYQKGKGTWPHPGA